MRRDDAPAFGKANPGLALASTNGPIVGEAREFQRDLAEVVAERSDVETVDGASKVCGRPAFAEGDDFIDTVQVFSRAKSDGMRRDPEHRDERFDVVVDECGFVTGI